MASEAAFRAYRAPCPACGAPVEFHSAQSIYAVCGYCRSTVVRDGEVLARVGKMAELFDDFSPLQLQTSGTATLGGIARKFTLVGRLQYEYGEGMWTEWAALLDDGSTAFLGEDNGAYVFSLPDTTPRVLPDAERFRVGATTAIGGKPFSVASNQQVSLKSAQGELPHLPALGVPFAMVELRSADGEVLSIDYSNPAQPSVSRGRSVLLDDLQLGGLKSESATQEKGQQFDCPNCGAPVQVTFTSTKSITCRACNSLMDLSQGVGGALAHALQDEPVDPLIALGSTGLLQGTVWQVIGFQHRMGREAGDDELFGWSEYLLYNAKRGFIFLVDAEDGWSLVKPVTGAPGHEPGSQSATYLGSDYRLLSTYTAETSYVAGEFYWRVVRGQTSQNQDFSKGPTILSREQTASTGNTPGGGEVTWSSGNKVNSATVVAAFKLGGSKALYERADAAPLSGFRDTDFSTIFIIIIIIVIIVVVPILLPRCSNSDSSRENSGERTSGGAYGGFSGGGGHK